MELWLALTLRDLGYLLYGGPLVAFAVLITLGQRIPGLAPEATVRTYRAWGPGLGLALGATILGALGARWIQHGAFSWSFAGTAAQLDVASWLALLALWVSNIKLEVWTLQPLRTLDPPSGITDPAAYRHATRSLARHLAVHAVLVVAVVVLARAAGSPALFGA